MTSLILILRNEFIWKKNRQELLYRIVTFDTGKFTRRKIWILISNRLAHLERIQLLLKPEISHRAKCRVILATPQTQYSFSRLSENYVRRESILKVRIMKLWSKRDVGIFWSRFFPAWHVLLCRATNARNARANKGWNALAGSGQVIPKGCHAPNEAWERKYTAPIDIILTFIRTTWIRRDRREIRISNDIFLKISFTKISFMMIWGLI